jgi:group II intron reverse transcriptase/maturase
LLRRFISKADGRLRPLGITALEDKIVQRAAVTVLNAIYEADFLGFSYGYRPGKSQHQALDALYVGLLTRKVNWVLDGDISGFFDSLNHEKLIKFIEHRIVDQRVLRLIRKWLNAGVLEKGQWSCSEEGTPQGGSASPLLANIYLHYVFDLWVQHWRKTCEQVAVEEARAALAHLIAWAPGEHVGKRRLARAVRAHDRVHFACRNVERHAVQNRLVRDRRVEVGDLKH